MNNTQLIILLIVFVGLFALAVVYCLSLRRAVAQNEAEINQKTSELSHLVATYAPIIDIDQAIAQRQQDVFRLNVEILATQAHHDDLIATLSEDYARRRGIYDSLLYETSLLESKLENISYGLY